jgi:HAD superfamily hydrolase (TIGR01509 family)
MVDWQLINTVFLDMDGTLLDLNFDNHFWQEHLPRRYSEKHGMDLDSAKTFLFPLFRRVEGTMDWYCVDYWSDTLSMDIAALKQEVDHLIALHSNVIKFLLALRQNGCRVVMVTNAHMKSLNLKMEKTNLAGYFDRLICAHDYGIPKEEQKFWNTLEKDESFDKVTTLLIDDSLPVLEAASRYGIANLLAIHKPDTQRSKKDVGAFPALHDFQEIMP